MVRTARLVQILAPKKITKTKPSATKKDVVNNSPTTGGVFPVKVTGVLVGKFREPAPEGYQNLVLWSVSQIPFPH